MGPHLIIKQLQASFQTLFCSCFFHLHHNLHHKYIPETCGIIEGGVFGDDRRQNRFENAIMDYFQTVTDLKACFTKFKSAATLRVCLAKFKSGA